MAINSINGNTLLESGFFPPVRVTSTGSPLNPSVGGLLTVDGVTLLPGDRVLCKDEINPVNNGLYSASTGPWVRTSDASGNQTFFAGMSVVVAQGTLNTSAIFMCSSTDSPVVVGTSAITFVRVSSAASTGGQTVFFNTRSAAISSTPTGAVWIQTAGYGAAGDGGGALYIKATGTTPGGFQTADGQWWQLAMGQNIDVRMFGAISDAVTDATAAFQSAIDLVNSNEDYSSVVYAIGDFFLQLTNYLTATGPCTIMADGHWVLGNTFVQGGRIKVIGRGSEISPPQFAIGPSLVVDGPSGLPCWLMQGHGPYLANVTLNGHFNGGALVLDGTLAGGGALARLDNVSCFCVNTNTADCVKINNWFWVWGYRCRFLGGSGAAPFAVLHITNTNPGPFANSSLTWSSANGGTVTVTTAAPHGLPTSPLGLSAAITISGVTPSGYNATAVNVTITGASTFTYPLASNPGPETVPGNWAIPANAFTGIIAFDDLIISDGGIVVDNMGFGPQLSGGGISFRQLSQENAQPNAGTLTLDASGGTINGIVVDGCVVADNLGGGGLLIKGGTVANVKLLEGQGDNDLIGAVTVNAGATISGFYADSSWTNGGNRFSQIALPQQTVGYDGDFILGALQNIGDTMSPAVTPVAPVVLNQAGQDASAWPAAAVSQGGLVTVTYGLMAPDGTPTAAKINTTGGSQVLYYDQTNYTPAVGDYVIMGAWVKNANTAKLLDGFALRLHWTSTSVLFNSSSHNLSPLGPSFIGANSVNGFQPMIAYGVVTATPGGVQQLNFSTRITDTSAFSGVPVVWHPWYYYIPAGTVSTDDILRLYQTLRAGPVNAQIGDIAVKDHQKLMLGGAVRLDSRATAPVKLLYRVGDRTHDTTGNTNGWLCTQAGGAFSVTRNAASPTAYTVGTWALWSTGTTISECTVAGTNSGGALAAPTTVGQTVVDGTVTWTCRSLTTALFAAANIAQSPNTQTGSTYTWTNTDYSVIANVAGTQTHTLPSVATNKGRLLKVKTIQNQTVVSVASNVIPLAGGGAGTAILAATAGKWAELQSDGTNWNIIAGN